MQDFSIFKKNYILLDSGSALGTKCGPLLIKKKSRILNDKSQIAIPGELTTANMLFSLAFSDYKNRIAMSFSEIESAFLHTAEEREKVIKVHLNN